MYVFLIDELSGGFASRSEVRKDFDATLTKFFVVDDELEDLPGVMTRTQERKAKEEAILEKWRDEQRQRV